ncbi:TPA: hypothetical protein KQC09_002490 [Clostridioides difficile]|uniref:hypothetical protein n=1 Tax=Clostridioides difficile TaxID=1496 RepID=UPI00102623EA|nr:hypothetical protein [Clostridioides difficile]VFB72266.1 Uncharacterised protein [Clostridioides difficile]HBE8485776.1 hypothetical protein [Clostridioides difficile]HBG3704170.1 hypothetical protein [Clostridioides difficile]HDF3129983.1 hypothetical protein [Clostridioides difficile]HDO9736251.1 hypothetical protein [Clostridioides difficile]
MNCKCRFCKKKLNTNDAYKVEHITSRGNKQNRYYCNEQEYRKEQQDIYFWKQCQLGIDYIMGYTVINNQKNKMLQEIIKGGYTREELYDCIIEKKDEVIELLNYRKDIEEEYPKLCYVFTILKGSIRDITIKNKQMKYEKENERIYKEVEKNEEYYEIIAPKKVIYNKRQSLFDKVKGVYQDE